MTHYHSTGSTPLSRPRPSREKQDSSFSFNPPNKAVSFDTSFDGLLAALEKDAFMALGRCKAAYTTQISSHHERVYELIAFLCAYNEKLKQDPDERKKLLEADLWDKRPRNPSEKRVTILAARYILGASVAKGALYSQALDYAKVASYYCAKKTPPTDIPGKLKRLTIYKLLDEIEAEESEEVGDSQEASPATGKDMPRGSPDAPRALRRRGAPAGDHDARHLKAEKAATTEGQRRPSLDRPVFVLSEDLSVKGGDHLEEVLALDEDDTVWLRIRCTDGGKPKRFVIVAVKPV